jgi:hypothetical protein
MTKHTPGPWKWSIDLRHRDIRLDAGSLVVMDFVRYGMQGAQPRFRLPEYGDVLIECAELAKEHSLLGHWPHPDARLIAAAPDLFEAATQAMVYFLMQDDESADDMTLSLQRHHTMQLLFPALRKARGITTVIGDTSASE